MFFQKSGQNRTANPRVQWTETYFVIGFDGALQTVGEHCPLTQVQR